MVCLHEYGYPAQQVLGQASVRGSFSSGPGAPHQEVTGSPLFPPLQRDALVSLPPPPGEAAAWPCRQVPTIPASKAGALLFPSLSAFFFAQPFHLFIYQVFTEYLLALGLEVQEGTRASGFVLMNLNLHHPAALKVNVTPSGRC